MNKNQVTAIGRFIQGRLQFSELLNTAARFIEAQSWINQSGELDKGIGKRRTSMAVADLLKATHQPLNVQEVLINYYADLIVTSINLDIAAKELQITVILSDTSVSAKVSQQYVLTVTAGTSAAQPDPVAMDPADWAQHPANRADAPKKSPAPIAPPEAAKKAVQAKAQVTLPVEQPPQFLYAAKDKVRQLSTLNMARVQPFIEAANFPIGYKVHRVVSIDGPLNEGIARIDVISTWTGPGKGHHSEILTPLYLSQHRFSK